MRFLFLSSFFLSVQVLAQDAAEGSKETTVEGDTEKRTERMVEGIKQTSVETRNMLQTLLLANTQSMASVQNMQSSVMAMKKTLEKHDAELEKCKMEMKQFKSATLQANNLWAGQSQVNTVESLLQMETELKKQKDDLVENRKMLMENVAKHGQKKRLSFLQNRKAAVQKTKAPMNHIPVMSSAQAIREHDLEQQQPIAALDEAIEPLDKIQSYN